MLRSLALTASVALGLVALSPDAALSQDRPRFAFGVGVDGLPFLGGQHLFGALLVPVPIERVTGRIEAMLHHGGDDAGFLALTGNLRASLFPGHSIMPYMIGGAGLVTGNDGALAANLGVGAEMPTRPWFLELRLHAFGAGGPEAGFLSLGIGTRF